MTESPRQTISTLDNDEQLTLQRHRSRTIEKKYDEHEYASTLKRLIACSVVYVIWALLAAIVAIAENRAGALFGFSTGLPPLQNFLYGMGTGMSPPLLHLVVQVVFTILAPRHDRWGGVGVVGLGIFGLLTVICAIFEPINLELLNPMTFNLPRAVIQSGMIIIPFAMIVFGILEWSRRRPRASSMHHRRRRRL